MSYSADSNSAMELTIAFCGDIMSGREVAERMGTAAVADWLHNVSTAWHGADLVIGNLECPCVTSANPIDGPLPEIIFHAPAKRLTEIAEAGFSAVTLANNHVLDCGALGLLETMQGLDRAGIHHAGAGMNLAEALKPALIPVRGLIIGLVAFCYGPEAGRSRPGVAPYDPKSMRKALATARKNSNLVIAALHDGIEYSDVPPASTRMRFRFLAENGADIVVGHHPHVLQGLEWHGGVPIVYSLGDLLFDNSLSHVAQRNFSRIEMGRYAPAEVRRDPEKFSRGAVLTIGISGTQKSIQWHPFRQDKNLRPQLLSGKTQIEDLEKLAELSAILQNEKDPRHSLANSVLNRAQLENLSNLRIQDVIKLALRPKWRYFPRGFKWLCRRMSFVKEPNRIVI